MRLVAAVAAGINARFHPARVAVRSNFTELFLPRIIQWAKGLKARCFGGAKAVPKGTRPVYEVQAELPEYVPVCACVCLCVPV